MARQLFGTDGVRGRAGEFLTAGLALSLARAAVTLIGDADSRTLGASPLAPGASPLAPGASPLAPGTPPRAPGAPPQVLIVRDTRESGEMLEAAIAAGVTEAGGDALLAGVLPTPAAPLLVRHYGLALAAVISASHNPYADNGIKLFAADGFKLADEDEDTVEAQLDRPAAMPDRIGRVRPLDDALENYVRALHSRFGGLDLTGRRVLLDCAHGATYRAAPEIFRRLGADVHVLAAEPDGRNINDGCGSTHPEQLVAAMGRGNHDIAFAFDGDGDRVLAVDRDGLIVDGDELVALAALHLRRAGRLPGGGVAVTVMTNFGFHTAMRDAGIEVATTPVGDRYVLDELRRRGWALGGEQSGHIIELGFGPSGDGIASALLTLEALGDRDLVARDAMRKLPQQLVNVRGEDRVSLTAAMESEAVRTAIARADQTLSGRGRVLVRASGTEPLIRVMVEAATQQETDRVTADLARVVESALGAIPLGK